ncbi:MAG TPA: hypothetical protein VFS41_06815 [Edaphobacter sp.]|nr:hypothetical protein [Edaphobacter sp.]
MDSFTSSDLRRELSHRNMTRARDRKHELSYGSIPSVIYEEEEAAHGNFINASYKAICARPEWRRRLEKSYTGGRWIARRWDRVGRSELDCANSSDALLMNIFCYPRLLHRRQLCAMLGIEVGVVPEFGVKPHPPLLNGKVDQTEIDMRLGDVMVEAKLTETSFRDAPMRLLRRYEDFEELFDPDDLRMQDDRVCEYQLLRGILAAYSAGVTFALFCDGRRSDLQESWFRALQAVRSYSFRSRLKLVTWQEIAALVPRSLQKFLEEKYGIVPV